jgi:hypothetical protein
MWTVKQQITEPITFLNVSKTSKCIGTHCDDESHTDFSKISPVPTTATIGTTFGFFGNPTARRGRPIVSPVAFAFVATFAHGMVVG